jgi:hypothetical protein
MVDLERRPKTYAKHSNFIGYFPIAKAKSNEQGMKYEAHLLKLVRNSHDFEWVNNNDKDSSRGSSCLIYIYNHLMITQENSFKDIVLMATI